MKREFVGINVQYPISQLIIEGKKTVETRTYPLPKYLLGKQLVLIETPGQTGDFKARMRAIICIRKCFKYESAASFYKDVARHQVTKDSKWAWDSEKGKWGWEIELIEVFKSPLPAKKNKGIVYSHGIRI